VGGCKVRRLRQAARLRREAGGVLRFRRLIEILSFGFKSQGERGLGWGGVGKQGKGTRRGG